MEDYYRRKYLSPSARPASTYSDSYHKERTVCELRKELAKNKGIEEKYDSVCTQVLKI